MNTFIIKIGNYLYGKINPVLATQLAYSPIGKFIFYLMIGFSNKKKVYNTTDNIKLLLVPKEAIGLGVFHLGTINKLESNLMKKLLKPGDIVIDIGTFVDGWHSLLAASLVGKKGKVYAFEPHPVYYERFKKNVDINRFTNIEANKLGLYDKSGSFTFYEASSGSTLVKKNAQRYMQSNQIESFTIQTVTLNEFVAKKKIKKIDFLKMDAEGVELNILKKADKILQGVDAPNLIIEVENEYLYHVGSSQEELITYLALFGYKPYMFTPEGIKPFRPGVPRPLLNLFFSKKKNILHTFT